MITGTKGHEAVSSYWFMEAAMSELVETDDKQVTHLHEFHEQIIIGDEEPILTTESSSNTQHDLDNISPGTLLCQRYEISKFLGRGGMSVVYQAHDTTTGRTVALKIIRAERQRNQDAVARAMQEAKTVVPLFHKNIAQLVTTDDDPDYGPILVMEFIEGSSISAYLSTFHGTRQEEAIRLCIQVCNALEYTHTHGIVHRDIKPSNIMVSTDGIAKVIDFGIAKIVQEDDRHIPLTQTNEMVGTSAYMSPEQCFGQPADVRCDVYQVGCLLFVFTNILPTPDTPIELLIKEGRNFSDFKTSEAAFEQANKLPESEKYYRKSLELEIRQPDAWTGLRNVLNKQGKHSEANAAARKALLFAP